MIFCRELNFLNIKSSCLPYYDCSRYPFLLATLALSDPLASVLWVIPAQATTMGLRTAYVVKSRLAAALGVRVKSGVAENVFMTRP